LAFCGGSWGLPDRRTCGELDGLGLTEARRFAEGSFVGELRPFLLALCSSQPFGLPVCRRGVAELDGNSSAWRSSDFSAGEEACSKFKRSFVRPKGDAPGWRRCGDEVTSSEWSRRSSTGVARGDGVRGFAPTGEEEGDKG